MNPKTRPDCLQVPTSKAKQRSRLDLFAVDNDRTRCALHRGPPGGQYVRTEATGVFLQCSHKRVQQKPHGVVLNLVYRAEHRCESSGAPAGAFRRPPRGRIGPGSGPTSTISEPPHIKQKQPQKLDWADLGAPHICHVYFYLFAAGTKNTKYPRTGLRIGLRG